MNFRKFVKCMIILDKIFKSFDSGQKKALSNITFSLEKPEIIAVLGHNGAGKSTLLDILGGIQKPDSGNITTSVPIDELGWCPQRQIIDWSLTAKQNIAIARDLSDKTRRLHKNSKKSSQSLAEIITVFGLNSYLHRTAETLSGGELRRIQIARALVNTPQLAILDEPTTGLDPDAINTVFNYIHTRLTEDKTTIISTHETSRFAQYCTRVIALDQGKIIADLPTETFMKSAIDKTDLWEAYKHFAS